MMAVTSAPVSSLKVMAWSLIPMVAFHDSTGNSVEVNQVHIVNRLCCNFSYPFAEALGTVVTFLLAFMADSFFCRWVWALSTPGTLLAELLLRSLLCCTCFALALGLWLLLLLSVFT